MKVNDFDTQESREYSPVYLENLLEDAYLEEILSEQPRTGETSEEMEEYRRAISALFADTRSKQALRYASEALRPRIPITRRWWFEPLLAFAAVMGVGFAVYVMATW